MHRQTQASTLGSTLDPGVYCSHSVFGTEVERVFRAGWVAVAHVSQLPAGGAFRSIDVADESLVVTRDRSGSIHVLSRVCPHRWMELCVGSGSSPTLQCPYHHWTFGLDGALRAAPAMPKTFDKSSCTLRAFRHEIWHGFVFVNLDGRGRPPSELWGPLSTYLEPYGLSTWRLVSTTDWGERPWDWKVLMDNGECYHHLGIHRRSLEPLYPARFVGDLPDNGEFTCLSAQPAAQADPPSLASRLLEMGLDAAFGAAPNIASRAAIVAYGAADPTLQERITRFAAPHRRRSKEADAPAPLVLAYPFPNYALALLPDVAYWYEAHPTGAGRTHLRTHQLLPPHLADARSTAGRVARNDAVLRVIHDEDERICQAVQRGVQTRSSDRGALAPLEQHNNTFARWYERVMCEREASCAS